MERIAVLMTCHNRIAKTLGCLNALYGCSLPPETSIEVFLVDDGSTDGTSEAVHEGYPIVRIIRADGSLFWNRGMAMAFDIASPEGFDYYLWLNDDTMLFQDAILHLIEVSRSAGNGPAIAVGAISDPITGDFAYGGARKIGGRWRPFLCSYVEPNGLAQRVDVMNGNVVLLPGAVAAVVGNIDRRFEHAMGDTDYALRAARLGIELFLTPGYVGSCLRNSNVGTHKDKGLSRPERLRQVFSRKGLPLQSWWLFCRRHGGFIWPVHFIRGYLKVLVD